MAIQVLDAPQNAQLAHRLGLRRLYMLKLAKDIRYLRRNMPGLEKMRLCYTKVPMSEYGQEGANKGGLEGELRGLH